MPVQKLVPTLILYQLHDPKTVCQYYKTVKLFEFSSIIKRTHTSKIHNYFQIKIKGDVYSKQHSTINILTYGCIRRKNVTIIIVNVFGNVGKIRETLGILACTINIFNFVFANEFLKRLLLYRVNSRIEN